MPKLILATNNAHKISEIKAILNGLDIEILSARDFPDFPEIEETGETLEANAILKARAIWQKYSLPAIADDTGLEVEHLDGAPGVYSARFAGLGCTYDDNNRKLLSLLDGVPESKRKARFRTVIAFADSNGEMHTVDGVLNGSIGTASQGKHGFGYDPIFIVDSLGKTLAELAQNEKNRVSHRGQALVRIRPLIMKAFGLQ
jgi:XTP/dITP diphosphohydrolase